MYSYEMNVGYSVMDEAFQMKVPAILDCFQDAAIFEAENGGKINTKYLNDKNLVWLLSSWQIVIDRRPRLNEHIKITTIPYDFKGFLGYRNFTIEDADKTMLVKAASIWTLLDTTRMMPAKPTQEVLDGYDLCEKIAMDYAPRKIAILGEGTQREPIPVRKAQIDSNKHVNNVEYVRMALEFVEVPEQIRELRVEYKRAAHFGDFIVPVVYDCDGKMQVQLKDTQGGLFAIVEFTLK
ncbi:MAG: acyl-[acyl-carrier-protein] thioesterase [Lachnospiraceae bacterium]|nr:acyl-[acyl-carrier-protein] thioesterase [Lachnospiraceae bacterium]